MRVFDILYSKGYLRQIGNVSFFFAGLNLLAGIIAVVFAAGNIDSVAAGIGLIVFGTILGVMGILIRRGWWQLVWVLAVFFWLDLLVLMFVPSGRAFGGALVARVYLVVALVHDFQRRRRAAYGVLAKTERREESGTR